MLDVMLCGAEDTAQIRDEFVDVVSDFGGRSLHFLSGDLFYVNAATSTWSTNSRITVQSADLCVFVIIEATGTITWQTEFREVISTGKPFVVLIRDSTYQRYAMLSQAGLGGEATTASSAERELVQILTEVEHDFQVTLIAFRDGGFADILRRQLSALFALGLKRVEIDNRRDFLHSMLHAPDRLTRQHLEWATELALDEGEDKAARKRAIQALAARRASSEDIALELLGSVEQGVQRLAFQLIGSLAGPDGPDEAFLREAIEIANQSDDVGLGRRLVGTYFELGLAPALRTLPSLVLTDVGLRRRIAEQLIAHEPEIIDQRLIPEALMLAARCSASGAESDWKARIKEFIHRHSPDDEPPSP